MKKAQGLPMNVIIIAALALLVLVILTIVFMGRIGVFTKESGACEGVANAGCFASTCGQGDAADYPNAYRAAQCSEESVNAGRPNCCIRVG